MPTDFYADAAPDQEETPASPEKETASDSSVATIPKQALGGKDLKPGDQVSFRVVQVNDDSVLVEASSGEEAEEKEEEPQPEQAPAPAPAPAPGGGGGMSAMLGQ